MNEVLQRIGLTVEQVRAALPERDRDREPDIAPRYLYGDEQKAVIQNLRRNHRFIVAQALRKVPTSVIAAHQGVSRQCISAKLSALGLTRRGRPPCE